MAAARPFTSGPRTAAGLLASLAAVLCLRCAPPRMSPADAAPLASRRWLVSRSMQVAIEENGKDGPQLTDGMATLKLACGGPGHRIAFFWLSTASPTGPPTGSRPTRA